MRLRYDEQRGRRPDVGPPDQHGDELSRRHPGHGGPDQREQRPPGGGHGGDPPARLATGPRIDPRRCHRRRRLDAHRGRRWRDGPVGRPAPAHHLGGPPRHDQRRLPRRRPRARGQRGQARPHTRRRDAGRPPLGPGLDPRPYVDPADQRGRHLGARPRHARPCHCRHGEPLLPGTPRPRHRDDAGSLLRAAEERTEPRLDHRRGHHLHALRRAPPLVPDAPHQHQHQRPAPARASPRCRGSRPAQAGTPPHCPTARPGR